MLYVLCSLSCVLKSVPLYSLHILYVDPSLDELSLSEMEKEQLML